MLEFDRIQHAYNGVLSVDRISFSVERGEVVSLLGPSGCGKTTLLRLAAGLEISQGDRLTVILPNSSAWLEYFIASMLGGWVFSPLPHFVHVQELCTILEYVKPKAIVTDRLDINHKVQGGVFILPAKEEIIIEQAAEA